MLYQISYIIYYKIYKLSENCLFLECVISDLIYILYTLKTAYLSNKNMKKSYYVYEISYILYFLFIYHI